MAVITELANKFKNMVVGWVDANADKYLMVNIPKEHVDAAYDEKPLVPMRDYFRIWLTEMSLGKSRTWFVDWFPAVHSTVNLKIAGQPGAPTLSHVAQAPNDGQAHGVFVNYAVTDLMPFMGGLVTIESALLALKGKNYLESAVRVLQGFSSLVAPPIGQALAVADKLSSGMQELFNSNQGEVHLGFHQTFASQGGGGAGLLAPGYIAVILATTNQIDKNRLFVRQDRLCFVKDGGDIQPLVGFDYFLYRIEGRLERDDWRLPEIDQAITRAAQAYLNGNAVEAQAQKTVALTAAILSPYLAVQDRRRVIQAIKDEMAVYDATGAGAAGGEIRKLDGIMAARAMGVHEAIQTGPITFEEVFGN